MTIEQRVQWVLLPNGATADGSRLRRSAFVAPRLRTDEDLTLEPFADFLDWPARLNDGDASFAVELPDGDLIEATVESEAADSVLWARFFGPTTVLAPFEFERFADRPIVSFSVQAVTAGLAEIYARTAAASPGELPRMLPTENVEPREPGLVDFFDALIGANSRGRLGEGVHSGGDLDSRITELLVSARAEAARRRLPGNPPGATALEPLPADGSMLRHYERVMLFHRRPGEPVAMPADRDATAAEYAASLDFHRQLSALGDHPYLLRRLGLVVDLTVRADATPFADDLAPLLLRLRPSWTSLLAPGESADVLPPTACVHLQVGGEWFFGAADREPNLLAPAQAPPTGLVALPETAYGLGQLDVDGGALKALNLATTLQHVTERGLDDTPLEEPERTGLPALRTGALALVHNGRAHATQRDFGRSADLNRRLDGGAPDPLFAEDLVRGYRLDVWEGRIARWRSLHQRAVTYEVEGLAAPLAPQVDEGFFELSMVAPAVPPGRAPDPTSEVYLHETVASWDGWSLAAARPGRPLSRDPRAPTDDDPDTQPQRVANDSPTDLGLSIETTALAGSLPRLRFNDGYRFRVRAVDLAGNGPSLDDADRRLAMAETDTPVVPAGGESRYLRFEPVPPPVLVPRTDYDEGASLQRLVIRSNVGVEVAGYTAAFNADDLVTSGRHVPYRERDDRHVVPPKAALELVERHGMLDAAIGSDGLPADDARMAAIAEAYAVATRERGALAEIEPAEHIEVPYLPDPLAVGAAFFGLPGVAAGEAFVVPFGGPTWYQAAPLRLELAEGTGPPAWDPDARVLRVLLPQASIDGVRVCSLLGADVRDMGVIRWCEEKLAPEDLDGVYASAAANRCWLLTPPTDLHLVHAVQQPLSPPAMIELEVSRNRDATFAHLLGLADVHVPSTDKVDLEAEWDEWIDDVTEPRRVRRTASQVVFALPTNVAARFGGDTDPSMVPYSLRDDRLLSFNSRPNVDVFANAHPVAPHDFGDTKHRRVRYRLRATTPFREYFPPEWASRQELLSVTGDAEEASVPASAPPSAPVVAYVVPTVEWSPPEPPGDGGVEVQRRGGGGLRVYLERPWYSSGDGELLGVVVGSTATRPTDPTAPFVTLIGRDPIRTGDALESARVERFASSVAIAGRVQLLELGASDLVSIVAYDAVYDETTERWFADIQLDSETAYFPFVRLALVRYQPDALDGCHVSHVVRCDIAQPLPDRTLSVRRPEPGVVDLAVAGPSYRSIRGPLAERTDAASLGRVRASVEERNPAFGDELIGWRPVPSTEIELAPTNVGNVTTWVGRVVVPRSETGWPQRIAVVETDHLAGDDSSAADGWLVPRIIYADVVDVLDER